MAKGLFITVEGIEGVGKTTQLQFIQDLLTAAGRQVLVTREPGGTRTGEEIREILLHRKKQPISDMTELLLIFCARAQHLDEVIRPALEQGSDVLCDRFTDATYAYQGGGREIGRQQVQILEALVQQGLKPDLTILFDAPVKVGLQRARDRSAADRFESQTVSFFERVRKAYLDIASEDPERVLLVNADQPVHAVQQDLRLALQERGIC